MLLPSALILCCLAAVPRSALSQEPPIRTHDIHADFVRASVIRAHDIHAQTVHARMLARGCRNAVLQQLGSYPGAQLPWRQPIGKAACDPDRTLRAAIVVHVIRCAPPPVTEMPT